MKTMKLVGEVVKRRCPCCDKVTRITITNDGTGWEVWRCENGCTRRYKIAYGGKR